MIGCSEKQDEFTQRFRRALGVPDKALPLLQRRGMNSAQGKPAVAIRQRDGQILRVLRDVGGNTPPTGHTILATKVVIICRHLEKRWQDSSEKQSWRGGRLGTTPEVILTYRRSRLTFPTDFSTWRFRPSHWRWKERPDSSVRRGLSPMRRHPSRPGRRRGRWRRGRAGRAVSS